MGDGDGTRHKGDRLWPGTLAGIDERIILGASQSAQHQHIRGGGKCTVGWQHTSTLRKGSIADRLERETRRGPQKPGHTGGERAAGSVCAHYFRLTAWRPAKQCVVSIASTPQSSSPMQWILCICLMLFFGGEAIFSCRTDGVGLEPRKNCTNTKWKCETIRRLWVCCFFFYYYYYYALKWCENGLKQKCKGNSTLMSFWLLFSYSFTANNVLIYLHFEASQSLQQQQKRNCFNSEIRNILNEFSELRRR